MRVRKFSSWMGDEIVIGEESVEEDVSLVKQQGFTLILAVLLSGFDGGEEVFDLVISSGIVYLRKIEEMVQE